MSDVHKHQTPEMHECIHNCEDCRDACLHAIHDSLKKGEKHAEPRHIGVLMDCVQICGACHDFMLRHSPLHVVTCRACAEICEACAESCEALGENECAEICRRCAKTCRAMSGAKA